MQFEKYKGLRSADYPVLGLFGNKLLVAGFHGDFLFPDHDFAISGKEPPILVTMIVILETRHPSRINCKNFYHIQAFPRKPYLFSPWPLRSEEHTSELQSQF